MSELAKSHIDIIDDSAYGAGTSAIIPLYVFATEQDKVIDEDWRNSSRNNKRSC